MPLRLQSTSLTILLTGFGENSSFHHMKLLGRNWINRYDGKLEHFPDPEIISIFSEIYEACFPD
jgi:hypothetical protein